MTILIVLVGAAAAFIWAWIVNDIFDISGRVGFRRRHRRMR